MIDMIYSGRQLNDIELSQIARKLEVSIHAQERIYERNKNLDIKNAILNTKLAYFNTDGSINIAIDNYNYLVIGRHFKDDKYVLITYKNKSLNDIDIYAKRNLALKGIKRK